MGLIFVSILAKLQQCRVVLRTKGINSPGCGLSVSSPEISSSKGFFMLRFVQVPLLLLLATMLTGCGETKTTSKAVAVLNIETVAMMTGADLNMQKAMQERNKQINEDLADYQSKIQATWKAEQEKVGEKPTEEQAKQLERTFQNLSVQSRQAQAKARENLASFQQELSIKFRELVSPISLEIAKEHGYSIVIIENPSLIAFDTAINITDLVVERMKETQGKSSGLPTVEGSPASTGTKLPDLQQPNIAPLNPPQVKSKLKLPEIKTAGDKKSDKKETPKETATKSEKEKPEAKPADKAAEKPAAKQAPKTEPKPKAESKPAADKKSDDKPSPAKAAESSEKK